MWYSGMKLGTRDNSLSLFLSVWISSFFPCGMLYSLRASYTKILASNEDLPQMSAWTPQTKDHDCTQRWSVDHHSNSAARITITKWHCEHFGPDFLCCEGYLCILGCWAAFWPLTIDTSSTFLLVTINSVSRHCQMSWWRVGKIAPS